MELERINAVAMNNASLIAPCGIFCGACKCYLRKKNPCPGCRAAAGGKPVTRIRCAIKNCGHLRKHNGFCSGTCALFPCADIKRLDARYRKKYNTKISENLFYIHKYGAISFLKKEMKNRKCHECGGVVCMHTSVCSGCGKPGVIL